MKDGRLLVALYNTHRLHAAKHHLVSNMCVCVCFVFFPCLGSVACWVSLHLLFVRVPSQRWILPEPRWAEGGTEEGWLVILWDVGGGQIWSPIREKNKEIKNKMNFYVSSTSLYD